MPEVYWEYKQCQMWQRPYYDGALADQPHLLMLEFTACRSAEADWEVEKQPLYEFHIKPKKLAEEQQWRRMMGT